MAQVDTHAMVGNSTFIPKYACSSTIMAMDIEKDMFLVGDMFMQKYYTIFDRDNDRIGLATANTSDKVKALLQKS
jgi:hypothetical protein